MQAVGIRAVLTAMRLADRHHCSVSDVWRRMSFFPSFAVRDPTKFGNDIERSDRSLSSLLQFLYHFALQNDSAWYVAVGAKIGEIWGLGSTLWKSACQGLRGANAHHVEKFRERLLTDVRESILGKNERQNFWEKKLVQNSSRQSGRPYVWRDVFSSDVGAVYESECVSCGCVVAVEATGIVPYRTTWGWVCRVGSFVSAAAARVDSMIDRYRLSLSICRHRRPLADGRK